MGRRYSWINPAVRFHALVAFGLALALAALIFLPHRHGFRFYHVLGAWLAGVNAATFVYYLYDKTRARAGGRRVPEVVLHALALAGGSPCAWLAMRLFRHKTIKRSFQVSFWCIVVVQLALIAWVGWHFWQQYG